MIKNLLIVLVIVFALTSCGKEKKAVEKTVETTKTEVKKVVESVKNDNSKQLAMGKALFTSKTCVACHNVDKKVIGPSIKNIVKVYADKNANMVKFLKGNSPAIVDTDPAQVAVMKANLEGFVKDMSSVELQAITAYMRSVGK